MEVKDVERIVVAKPIASRPRTQFKSFSELLAGAINASPPRTLSEASIAIRPKTVRFRPSVNRALVGVVSSQGEISGTTVSHLPGKVLNPDQESTMVYKPLAKLVSRTTVALLANMGNFNISHQNAQPQEMQAQVHVPDQLKHHKQIQLTSNHKEKVRSLTEMEKMIRPSKLSQSQEHDQISLVATNSGDRPSYDGYNWRKYGQKQVKGSEYPRSYYKCTNPNCLVKKKVERSLDGLIAEIVYKGEHNHPKPQPPKRPLSGIASDDTERDSRNPLCSTPINERNEGTGSRMENQNEVGLMTNYLGKPLIPQDPSMAAQFSSAVANDNSCGMSEDCEEGSRHLDGNGDEPNSKRRKIVDQAQEVVPPVQGVQDPHVMVQTSTESEILADGFRWRKYGQKVVKRNPYPRSYYRCTNLKCNVRKYVERASEDPRAFITTYEGKHNHDMPVPKSLNPVSDKDSLAPSNKSTS